MAVRMTSSSLDGPRLPPASGKASHLVVLCHGYGADGNDLIELAPHWQQFMPDVAFAAPHAPEPCAGAPMGRQWFGLSRLDPEELRSGVESAAPVLDRFLDSELARYGLPPERLALVGFSQGTMMSLKVGLSRAVKPAAIVGYSGLLATMPEAGAPILLIHGEADPMLPPQGLFHSAAALGRAGAAVQWHLSPGLGHAIDAQGLQLGGDFLAMAFAGVLQQAGEIACSLS